MNALTICQPYAELIARGIKRVENRVWETLYRGPLLIHAGKSRKFLSGDNYGIPESEMQFGAIVANADLTHCRHISSLIETSVSSSLGWLLTHEHVEGPFCWVLENIRRLPKPIPWMGAMRLFDVPDAAFETNDAEEPTP